MWGAIEKLPKYDSVAANSLLPVVGDEHLQNSILTDRS